MYKSGDIIFSLFKDFLINPYRYFTEKDIHAYLHKLLELEFPMINNISRVHQEYPYPYIVTYKNFNNKNDYIKFIKKNNNEKLINIKVNKGARPHLDLCVLSERFIKDINNFEQLTNKDNSEKILKMYLEAKKEKPLDLVFEIKKPEDSGWKKIYEMNLDFQKLFLLKKYAKKNIQIIFKNKGTSYFSSIKNKKLNANQELLLSYFDYINDKTQENNLDVLFVEVLKSEIYVFTNINKINNFINSNNNNFKIKNAYKFLK